MFSGTLWQPNPLEHDGWEAVAHVRILEGDVLAKADQPGERWITLHPHGKDGDSKGVPVKIKTNPDGTAHVVTGPGELRGLRLTRLASPEELARRKAERDEGRKEKRAQDKKDAKDKDQRDLEASAADPAEAQRLAQEKLSQQKADEAKTTQLEALDTQMRGLHDQLLEHAATITGDADYLSDRARAAGSAGAYENYKDHVKSRALTAAAETQGEENAVTEDAARYAGGVIASRNVRQVSSAISHLRRDVISNLVADRELRAAVLGDLGELSADDALGDDAPSSGPGYARNARAQAEERGYSPEDAREEAQGTFDDRIMEIEKDDKDRAAAIVEMSERVKGNVKATATLQGRPDRDGKPLRERRLQAKVPPKAVLEHAEHVASFLNLHRQLADLERQKRALMLGRDAGATEPERRALEELDNPLPKGAEVNAEVGKIDPEFAARLEKEVSDAAKADVTRAFLNALGEDGEEGQADQLIRDRMQAHIGAGAHAHLANVALAVLGHEGVDRMVVDALGVDAGAQLTAYALARDAAGRTGAVRDGLAAYHDDTSVPRMQEAMALATAARADAAELELPSITASTDLAVVKDLQKRRREAIGGAHAALGSALGAVEAGAALNLAMKGDTGKPLTVRFGGAATAGVATQLRALGLTDGEYSLERSADGNHLTATITPAGMDRLTPPVSAEQQARNEEIRAIKSGERDQPDYLPAGFMARADTDVNPDPGVPTPFQVDADWTHGPETAAATVAGSMYADGYKPSEILTHLLDTVGQQCPDGQRAAFGQAVATLIPFAGTEQRTAKDGTAYTAHVARDVDTDPQVEASLSYLASQHVQAHHPGEADFHTQGVPDSDATREALFRAVAERPALQAAFSPPADLGGTPERREKATAVKLYFFQHVLGLSNLREYDEQSRAAQTAAVERLGPVPEKWGAAGGSMFDLGAPTGPAQLQLSPHATPEQHVAALRAYGLRPEHYQLQQGVATLTPAGQDALQVPDSAPTVDGDPAAPPIVAGGLDALNPDWVRYQRRAGQARAQHKTLSDHWQDYRDTVGGGTRKAYESVQEVMQDDLLRRFTAHHASLSGTQLRVSKQTTRHWEKRLAATDPDEARRIRQRDRSVLDQVRQRDHTGRYLTAGEGGLGEAVRAHLEQQARQAQLQGSLFGLQQGKGGGEVTGKRPADLDIGAHERLSLGRTAEGQLSRILQGTPWGIKAGDTPNKLHRNLSWGSGTKHVTKQRAVKLLLATGRMAGWLGAGSGKTGTMLGAYTQAKSEGSARKALYVVPSIVRNQFGEAAAKFTQPGTYSWHAEDAPYDVRKAHYTGHTDMVVVTHQTFRDDMLRLLGEHRGMSAQEAGAWFGALPREERAQAFRAMTEHHGIPNDMLHVDEAHDFLNRQGKADSTMSKVLEAAMDNARFKALWTGSPVKNDPSEVHDWLAKLDPARFHDREDFMRRYGVNTKASAEALQRLVDSYSVIDSVRPDVDRHITWGRQGDAGPEPITLSPAQQQAYQGVHEAFDRASAAARRGDVDVDAMKVLSPRSFEKQPAAQHRDIAAKLQGALGTLKHSALGRVVNEHGAADNAKVQHVLQLAAARTGRGGVIFARNKRSIAMLKEQLEAQGHRVGVINGDTTTDEKGVVRRRFDAGDVDIVLASDAGATGANLQHRGEWLVNYDLPQTQKTLEQRNARIDRLGQSKAIELHHLVTDTPYDRDNVKRLDRKRELGSILQGEYRDMEDTGIASYIRRARAERGGDVPDSWEEPLTPAIDENARPQAMSEAEGLYDKHTYNASGAAQQLMDTYGPSGGGQDVLRQYAKVVDGRDGPITADELIGEHVRAMDGAAERQQGALGALGAGAMQGRHVYGSFRRPLDAWAGGAHDLGAVLHAKPDPERPFTVAHSYLSAGQPLSAEQQQAYDLQEVHRPGWALPAAGSAGRGGTRAQA